MAELTNELVLIDPHTGGVFQAGETRLIAVPDDEEGYWEVLPDVAKQMELASRYGVPFLGADDEEGSMPATELANLEREYLAVDLSSGFSSESPQSLVAVPVPEGGTGEMEPEQLIELAHQSGVVPRVSDEVLELP